MVNFLLECSCNFWDLMGHLIWHLITTLPVEALPPKGAKESTGMVTDKSGIILCMPLAGRLKIARAALKLKFWNEWMNERNILGFKLCAEAEKFSDALAPSHQEMTLQCNISLAGRMQRMIPTRSCFVYIGVLIVERKSYDCLELNWIQISMGYMSKFILW